MIYADYLIKQDNNESQGERVKGTVLLTHKSDLVVSQKNRPLDSANLNCVNHK